MESQDNFPDNLLALPTDALRKTQEDIRVEIEKRFHALYEGFLAKAKELVAVRSPQFNRGAVRIQDYYESRSAFWRLHDKALRIKSMALRTELIDKAQFTEELLDLVNYAAFLYAALVQEGSL